MMLLLYYLSALLMYLCVCVLSCLAASCWSCVHYPVCVRAAVKLDFVAKPCPQFDPSANLPPPPLLQSLLLWRGSAITTHPR